MSTLSAHPTFAPVDPDTATLLDLLHASWLPFADCDRNTVAQAIKADAEANCGHVSPNRVRSALAALPRAEQPKPQRVGPVYRALVCADVLAVDGWETSDDLTGRNSGKPHKTYRWIGDPR